MRACNSYLTQIVKLFHIKPNVIMINEGASINWNMTNELSGTCQEHEVDEKMSRRWEIFFIIEKEQIN